MANPIMRYFATDHLAEELQQAAGPIRAAAEQLDREIPDGPEKSAGLRKLLEAKDCMVRAKLDA